MNETYNDLQALKDMAESIELQRQISKDLIDCMKLLKERIEKLEVLYESRVN